MTQKFKDLKKKNYKWIIFSVVNPDGYKYAFEGNQPSAESDIETKQFINFLQENLVVNTIKTFIVLYSYSQMITFPYGHTVDYAENYEDHLSIGRKASEKIKKSIRRHLQKW